MDSAPDRLLAALADPTRRGIFDRLCRDGEQTVHALRDHAGISQPGVSKHLRVLTLAGLVRHRRAGREARYSANPAGLAPLVEWIGFRTKL